MSERKENSCKKPWRVMIVEGDELQRHKLSVELMRQPDFFLAQQLGTKHDALRYLDQYPVDFLIINIKLPDGNGCECMLRCLRYNPQGHILVCTDTDDESYVMQAVSSGANGYILYADNIQIVDCLRLLKSGGSPVSPQIARNMLRALHTRLEDSPPPPSDCPLTSRELDVLRHLSKGEAFSEIATVLSLSEHTVTTHLKKIYKKLGVHSRGEAVYTARKLGFLC